MPKLLKQEFSKSLTYILDGNNRAAVLKPALALIPQKNNSLQNENADWVGIEPTTIRLEGGCSIL